MLDTSALVNRFRELNPEPEKQTTEARRAAWRKSEKVRRQRKNAGPGYTTAQWHRLLDAYGRRCLCCGTTEGEIVFDHVQAMSQGGEHSIANGQPLCRRCNDLKHTRTVDYRPDGGAAARRIAEGDAYGT